MERCRKVCFYILFVSKVKEGLFEVTYEVKNQGNKKKVIYYVPTTNDVEHFQNKKNQLSKPLSQKQKEIYQFFRHFQPHTVRQMERKVAECKGSIKCA